MAFGLRTIRSFVCSTTGWIREQDQLLHSKIESTFPKTLAAIVAVSQVLYELVSHPIFNFILALVWVVLGVTGVVDKIVSWSLAVAWFVALLGVSKSKIA